MNKKELYESIMKNVAKEVKKALNEWQFDKKQYQYALQNYSALKYFSKTLEKWINGSLIDRQDMIFNQLINDLKLDVELMHKSGLSLTDWNNDELKMKVGAMICDAFEQYLNK